MGEIQMKRKISQLVFSGKNKDLKIFIRSVVDIYGPDTKLITLTNTKESYEIFSG
jgi:hypothetical protein